MEMSVWVWVTIAVLGIAGYLFYKRKKLPWLKKLKAPKLFEPKPGTLTERLKVQTEKEVVRAEELRKVLEAKTELAKARAANIKLKKEIDGISEKSVRKAEREAQEAQKVKPRRL